MTTPPRFAFGSVRVRLTVWNVLVLALVLAVLGAAFRYRLQTDSLAAIDSRLAAVTDDFQRHLPPDGPPFHRRPPGPPGPPPGPFPQDAPNPPPPVAGEPSQMPPPRDGDGPPPREPDTSPLRRFRPHAVDRQGHSLFPGAPDSPWDAGSGLAHALRGQPSYTNIALKGEHLRVYSQPLRQRGQIIGAVQMANSLAPLNESVRQMTRTLLTLIPLALLIAGFGGAFLTDRALRPVRDITQSAGQIEASNLSGRLPVTGRDEFSLLAATFNAMLERLETAFARLEQSFQQQRRFTADASHELRTPLTIIKANTSLALSGERTPEQYRHALAAADKAADRMNRIVQDLLLLARTDAAPWEARLAPTPLADVLEEAAEPLQTPAHPAITLDLPADPLLVMGDQHALLRLFTNLLENAVRHTPQGGKITITATATEQFATVAVTDTGEGIAPEHLPHLTERFYRVDAARAREGGGTGLGLAICQSIVDAHGGSLAIASTVGQGTAVTVTIPRA